MKNHTIQAWAAATLAIGMHVRGDNLAAVPAFGDGALNVTENLGPPPPVIVRLVGQVNLVPEPQKRPTETFVMDLKDSVGSVPVDEKSGPRATIPKDARWPDSNDRLLALRIRQGVGVDARLVRNPWEEPAPRIRIKSETAFACGGIICTASGEDVALLNGKIVRMGSAFGPFTVSLISPDAVVLELEGVSLVIPRGRRVTVEH